MAYAVRVDEVTRVLLKGCAELARRPVGAHVQVLIEEDAKARGVTAERDALGEIHFGRAFVKATRRKP